MAGHKLPPGKAMTWKVMVRMSPNVKAVVQEKYRQSGDKTFSAFVRRALWEYCRPEGDASQA